MLKNLINKSFSREEWVYIKIPLIIYWFLSVSNLHGTFNGQPFPVGVCEWVNCAAFTGSFTYPLFIFFSLILVLAYVAEWKMTVVTFFIAVISVISFSLEESNGIYTRTAIVSAIFIVQFLAYAFHDMGWIHNLHKYRIHFMLQVITAGYTLAAISKLTVSGIDWVTDGPRIALQVVKSFSFAYIQTGKASFLETGAQYAGFLLNHAWLVKLILGFSLVLEISCILALINRRVTFVYGLLLLGMHIGIHWLMDIIIMPMAIPMVLVFINPFYHIHKGFKMLMNRKDRHEIVILKLDLDE